MVKHLLFFTLALFFFQVSEVFSQISIGTVDPGPYGNGSHITVPISFPGNISDLPIDNKFEVFLSDANGNFAGNGTLVGTFNGFYTPAVNGTIPPNLPTGSGYRLRIRTSNPNNTPAPVNLDVSGNITIVNQNLPNITLTQTDPSNQLSGDHLGVCPTAVASNRSITLEDNVSAATTVTLTVTNLVNGSVTILSEVTDKYEITGLAIGYYSVVATASSLINGQLVKSIKTYTLHNEAMGLGLGDNGVSIGCLSVLGGGSPVSYGIININNNYPGTIYSINWGDGVIETFTRNQIINNSNLVTHTYTETSCGRGGAPDGSNNNSFQATISTIGAVCNTGNKSLTAYAQVFLNPVAKITGSSVGCVNTEMTFNNTSLAGTNIDCSDEMLYTWYIDNNPNYVLRTRSKIPLKWTFTAPGNHSVRLVASNEVQVCEPSEFTFPVCIQTPPIPAFIIAGATNGCAPFPVQLQDQSNIYTDCGPPPAYKWIVTDANGVRFTNFTDNIPNPSFVLNTPGVYTIKLELTGFCGVISSVAPDPIVITNGPPEITLSGPKKLCTLGRRVFDDTDVNSPTYTTFSGSPVTLANTYTWTVTNENGDALTSDDYSFDVGSTTNSKFPAIIFKKTNIQYNVTVLHTNTCDSKSKTQILEFFDAPIISAGPDQDLCFNQNLVVQLNGTVPPNIINPKWAGGSGTFGNVNDPITTYTPTPQERNSGVPIVLNFSGQTNLEPPCSTVTDEIRINIKKEILITSSPIKSICSNTNLNYAIVSNQSGTSYTWTATGSANADGYLNSTTPNQSAFIADRLINNDLVNNATVTYTITPYNYGCQGEPFTLTVTITPTPILSATPVKPVICSHTSSNINLISTLGTSTKYTWISTKSDGSPANLPQPIPVATTTINEDLINNSNLQETITYTITPISASDCPGAPVTVIIKVDPAVTLANAGPDESICNTQFYTLKSPNTSLKQGETAAWNVSPAGPVITPNNQGDADVTNLTIGTDYTFTWTITASSGCSTTDDVILKVLRPIVNTVTVPNTTTVCEGQTISINGDLPTGGAAPYLYRWQQSTDNGTNWIDIPNANAKDLIYTISERILFRRIVTGGACEALSAPVEIMALPAIGNNNIRNDQAICPGSSAQLLTGDAPTGGDGSNYTYQWEKSIDNGNTWTAIQNATSPSYLPGTLTERTLFRRRVSSGLCSGTLGNISNKVTIDLYPSAIAEFTTESLIGCPPFLIDKNNIKVVQHPGNATYTWYVNNVFHGTGPDFPDYTISDGNESIEIKLVVTSTNGCTVGELGEKIAIFSTRASVNIGFTQSIAEGCGPLPVTFTNTSSSLANVTFKWDFGNGQTSPSPNPPTVNYQPDPLGNDITYVVTLTAETPCSGIVTSTSTVLVRAKPIAIFTPDKVQGCSPFKVVFKNTSPGTSNKYYYDFGDGATDQKDDNGDVQHIFNVTTTTDFVVRMVAENGCGNDVKEWTIRVFPQNMTPVLGVTLQEEEDCAPHTVNFQNNSIGANRFFFDFGDGNTQTTFTTGIVPHTYTTSGTFTVTMTAYNICSEIAVTKTINVLPQPVAEFQASATLGCPGLVVKFNNNSEGGRNNSYLWDFGDGSTSTDFEPEYAFTGNQEFYTVTLTATNQRGCPTEISKNQYIHIVQPPQAAFHVNPSTLISIPDYTFHFQDESTNTPTIWHWDFGDKVGTSALKNPSYTYLDTGTYRVTLRVQNQQGCFTTTFKDVTIKGVPGYLFVPNSFVPGSTQPELREFRAKGSGIQTWRFSIFNKWGQILWETTNLTEGRPAEGWDGTFKGQPLPQGVYYWKIDVQMVNGSEWKGMTYDKSAPKRTGAIHLIR